MRIYGLSDQNDIMHIKEMIYLNREAKKGCGSISTRMIP